MPHLSLLNHFSSPECIAVYQWSIYVENNILNLILGLLCSRFDFKVGPNHKGKRGTTHNQIGCDHLSLLHWLTGCLLHSQLGHWVLQARCFKTHRIAGWMQGDPHLASHRQQLLPHTCRPATQTCVIVQLEKASCSRAWEKARPRTAECF